jgi:hypothetical protein
VFDGQLFFYEFMDNRAVRRLYINVLYNQFRKLVDAAAFLFCLGYGGFQTVRLCGQTIAPGLVAVHHIGVNVIG